MKPLFFFKNQFLKKNSLATWLFVGTLFIYLITRLIGLTQFPIFFFVDEALQTQFASDLVKNNFRGIENIFLPPAFQNGSYFTLGMGVYMQVLPYLIFGKSAFITRATSVIITLIAAISTALILRGALKIKYWWAGVLFLSITPTWFLHSRTAWETAEFVAFYSGALCAYTFYRIKSPNYLYLAILLGALGFYTYSPAQVIIPFTAFAFTILDWRYHWENRRTVLFSLILLAILSIQYFRFRALDPDNALAHLHRLGSYWFTDISIWEKIRVYISTYLDGLSIWYWYIPREDILPRHVMKGYGQIMLATLPFALLGLTEALRRIREPIYRIILTAWLASPIAAALVQVGVTRTLSFVFPTAILTTIGLARVLSWIENPSKQITDLMEEEPPSRMRILSSITILLFGGVAAFFAKQFSDKAVLLALTLLLAIETSGAIGVLLRQIKKSNFIKALNQWKISYNVISWIVFILLSSTNILMLVDALRNASTWYRDYGLNGMQYGGFQIFDIVKQYTQEHPDTTIIFSPDWANGADILARFFLDDPLPIQIGSIKGHINKKLPLDDKTLFIITPNEYQTVQESSKFTDLYVEKIIPYPDGSPGFYFIRLRYVDNVDEIFATEETALRTLQESILVIEKQEVKIRHSLLDGEEQKASIALVFDSNPSTFTKTFETNPFVIELRYPAPKTIHRVSVVVGTINAFIVLTGLAYEGAEPITYYYQEQGTINKPTITFDLPEPLIAEFLRIEILDVLGVEPVQVHIWEITFR